MALHQDPLRLLDQRATAERTLSTAGLGVAPRGDVNLAAHLVGSAVPQRSEIPPMAASSTNRGSSPSRSAINGQAAWRPTSETRSRAPLFLAETHHGHVRSLSLGGRATWDTSVSRETTSCPNEPMIAAISSGSLLVLIGDQHAQPDRRVLRCRATAILR